MGSTPLAMRDKYHAVARKVFGKEDQVAAAAAKAKAKASKAKAKALAGRGRGRRRGRGRAGAAAAIEGASTLLGACSLFAFIFALQCLLALALISQWWERPTEVHLTNVMHRPPFDSWVFAPARSDSITCVPNSFPCLPASLT